MHIQQDLADKETERSRRAYTIMNIMLFYFYTAAASSFSDSVQFQVVEEF